MKSTLGPGQAAQEVTSREPRRRVDGRLIVLLVVVALYSRGTLTGSLNPVVLRTWTTVFVAIVVQALPFLVLGVLVSGAITALVSPAVLERLLPRSTVLAVPSAALAGTALPGCECASVPIAGRLCARGVQPAAAVAGVHVGRSRGQSRRAGGDRGGLPRAAADGAGPVLWLAGDLGHGRAPLVAGGRPEVGGAGPRPGRRQRRPWLAGLQLGRPPRPVGRRGLAGGG